MNEKQEHMMTISLSIYNAAIAVLLYMATGSVLATAIFAVLATLYTVSDWKQHRKNENTSDNHNDVIP